MSFPHNPPKCQERSLSWHPNCISPTTSHPGKCRTSKGKQVLLPGLEGLVAILLRAYLPKVWRWCPKSLQKGLFLAKSHFPLVQRTQEVFCPSSQMEGKAGSPPQGPCLCGIIIIFTTECVPKAYVYTHVCVCIGMSVHMFTYVGMCMVTCVRTIVYVYATCMCVFICAFICSWCVCTCVYAPRTQRAA